MYRSYLQVSTFSLFLFFLLRNNCRLELIRVNSGASRVVSSKHWYLKSAPPVSGEPATSIRSSVGPRWIRTTKRWSVYLNNVYKSREKGIVL